MDFTGIGKISAFTKQKNLIFAANYRIKTGQRLTDDSGSINFSRATLFSQTKTSKSSSTSAADSAKMAIIKQKLRSGRKLSGAEMSYLRENDSKLYKKAKYAEETREELKSALKEAKTKQEAREAVMHAMAKVAADVSADFEALKGNGAAGGANMNFGGDISADTNVDGNISADTNVGSNISADANVEGDISADANVNAETGGETSNVTDSNNLTTATENSNVQNENSVAQDSTSEESDTAFDIFEKYLYAIRAIQYEWLEFIKSDKYKDMPEDIFEEAEILAHGGRKDKNKISGATLIDAITAYRAAMDFRQEL